SKRGGELNILFDEFECRNVEAHVVKMALDVPCKTATDSEDRNACREPKPRIKRRPAFRFQPVFASTIRPFRRSVLGGCLYRQRCAFGFHNRWSLFAHKVVQLFHTWWS